jgi:ABC-2 type transport system ATP-binding protein
MDEVSEVCDRVIFLSGGRIVAVGTPEELAASAASTRLGLHVVGGLEAVLELAAVRGLACRQDGREVELDVEEHEVAEVLSALAAAGVVYGHITLERPTLEDYFLKLAGAATRAGRETEVS